MKCFKNTHTTYKRNSQKWFLHGIAMMRLFFPFYVRNEKLKEN